MDQSQSGYAGVLTRIFSTGATAKILDYFLDHKEYDYSIAEIAAGTGLSFRTLAKEVPRLQGMHLITIHRKVGNTNMFKLNGDSDAASMLERFSLLAAQNPSLFEPVKIEQELLAPDNDVNRDQVEESGLEA